ncbi:hypothetical protein Q4506_16845 [Colwellia sp. 4_MG-2023]|jgi:hypothetical protein|uniref:hypothetical protein n=1 Tax=unclassified Colwellia TaxID=196834 RepID=UPI0026E1E2E7|nr:MULTISPECIES: hypothetical protein [unclassified Colwellia]MDO6508679.1 hypothetical protein [Colwellia sp. 5_MG-2023]MDO6557349.1 hypothetical protein [Colwellia sp. 4_MG-2023]
MLKRIKPIWLLSLLSIVYQPVMAHQKVSLSEKDSIKVLAAITYRNNQIVESGEIWQPQGFLVGGEAVPAEDGASLDDAQLQGYMNLNKEYYVAAKLSAHSHSGENSLELENLWFGTEFQFAQQMFQIEAGKISTEVTDTINYHSSIDIFSQAPLSADILFGRHFTDIGARFALMNSIDQLNSSYKLGIELFSGDNFPATSGDGSISAFSHLTFQSQSFQSIAKLWVMYAKAEQREDVRYSEGHSHGVSVDNVVQSFFTGDTLSTGIYLDGTWDYEQWRFHGEFEWIQAQIDGQISTTTQSAYMDAVQSSYRLAAFVEREKHSLHLEYEILSVDNEFSQTTETFIEQVGLSNNGFEPNRLSVGWHYAFHPDFILRTEWMRDESNELSQVSSIVSLGIQWRYNLL